jgi:hypothetical protein
MIAHPVLKQIGDPELVELCVMITAIYRIEFCLHKYMKSTKLEISYYDSEMRIKLDLLRCFKSRYNLIFQSILWYTPIFSRDHFYFLFTKKLFFRTPEIL